VRGRAEANGVRDFRALLVNVLACTRSLTGVIHQGFGSCFRRAEGNGVNHLRGLDDLLLRNRCRTEYADYPILLLFDFSSVGLQGT